MPGETAFMGAVAAALGVDGVSLKKYFINNQAEEFNRDLVGELRNDLAANRISLAEFTEKLKAAGPLAERLATDDVNRLTNVADQVYQVDPQATLQGFLDKGFNFIKGIGGGVGNWYQAAQKLKEANLGYGGRGGGLYVQRALQKDISRDVLPLANTWLASAGPTTLGLLDAGRQKIGDTINVLRERASIPYRNVGAALLPIRARAQSMADIIRQNMDIIANSGANFLGASTRENKWGKVLKGLGQASEQAGNWLADVGTNLFSSYTGGKGGGTNMSTKSKSGIDPNAIDPNWFLTGGNFAPAGTYLQGGQGGTSQNNPYWRYPGGSSWLEPYPDMKSLGTGYEPGYQPGPLPPQASVPYDAYFTGYA